MPNINLKNVEVISRGDNSRKLKYLLQFVELVPNRCSELQSAFRSDDRLRIREILHKMSPQVQFFEIHNTIHLLKQIERDFDVMDYYELGVTIVKIVHNLEAAVEEVKQLISD